MGSCLPSPTTAVSDLVPMVHLLKCLSLDPLFQSSSTCLISERRLLTQSSGFLLSNSTATNWVRTSAVCQCWTQHLGMESKALHRLPSSNLPLLLTSYMSTEYSTHICLYMPQMIVSVNITKTCVWVCVYALMAWVREHEIFIPVLGAKRDSAGTIYGPWCYYHHYHLDPAYSHFLKFIFSQSPPHGIHGCVCKWLHSYTRGHTQTHTRTHTEATFT